jgi:spermidine/putrescine transport system substrate-binding protein
MRKNELLDRMASGRLTRRQLIGAMAAAGVGMVALTKRMRSARADDALIYFTWTGYDVPGFFPAYAEKHGNPEMPIFAEETEAFTKLRGGFVVDVAHPCSARTTRWREANLIQPMDPAKLSHWSDIFPTLQTINNANAEGKQWFAPVDWGNTSIVYRPDLVEISEESYGLLWDERYKGRLSIGQDVTDTLIIVGLMAGAKDPYNMTDEELAKVKELLLKQKSLLRFYWDDNTTMEQAIASGELVASTAWNSSYVTLKGQGVDVKYMKPKEGILSYCCGLVIGKDAPHLDLAHEFIDAMLSPEAGVWLITEQGYGHSNRKTFDTVDPKILAERGLPKDPTELLSSGVFSREIKRIDDYERLFESVKAQT